VQNKTLQQPAAGSLDGLDRDGENMKCSTRGSQAWAMAFSELILEALSSFPSALHLLCCMLLRSISLCLCAAIPLDPLGLMLTPTPS
jgi:hypothetical protein